MKITDDDLPPLPEPDIDGSDIDSHLGMAAYTAEAVRQAQREAFAAGMEKAARMCDGISSDHWDRYKGRGQYGPHCEGRADPHYQGMSDGAEECSTAIIAASQGE